MMTEYAVKIVWSGEVVETFAYVSEAEEYVNDPPPWLRGADLAISGGGMTLDGRKITKGGEKP